MDLDFTAAIESGRIRSQRELKLLYRRLSKHCHPDLAPGPDQGARFVVLRAAYEKALAHPALGGHLKAPAPVPPPGPRDVLDLHAALMAPGWPSLPADRQSRSRLALLAGALAPLGVNVADAGTELASALAGRCRGVDAQAARDMLFLLVSHHHHPAKPLLVQWQRRWPALRSAMLTAGAEGAAAYMDLLARNAGLD